MSKPEYRTAEDEITFNILNENVVKRLQKQGEVKLPQKKVDVPRDMRWNLKTLNSMLLQGIQNGDSVKKIAASIFPEVNAHGGIVAKNQQSAIRSARTMTTEAENRGRLDSYDSLADQGVVQKKVWIATPDDRTRESHLEIDGEEVDIDEPFSNGLMYPADPDGDPAEVWNCRCSMRTHIVGVRKADGHVEPIGTEREQTMHNEQIAEERERRGVEPEDASKEKVDIDFTGIPLTDSIIDAATEYADRMSDVDRAKFNAIFKNAQYVEGDESYYDPATNKISISQTEPRDTTAFHESTHYFDFNQDYTITADYGRYKYLTDENGDLTGEKVWQSDIVTIKEHVGFSEYVASQWNTDTFDFNAQTWIDSGSKQDIRNFVKIVGTSDTYGMDKKPADLTGDLKAINAYLNSKGVSKVDPDFVHLSDFISAISYDSNLGSLITGGHSYNYWVHSDSNRVTEITAGYNLLRATGRNDLIEIERELAPNLMDIIEKEWKKIW